MISWTTLVASVAVASGTGNAADQPVHPLQRVDEAVLLVGLVLVIVFGGRWLVRDRRDPLASAPSRPNDVPPESVFLPIVVLLIVTSLTSWAIGAVGADLSETLTARAAQTFGMAGAAAMCLFLGARFFHGGLAAYLRGGTSIGRQVLRAVAFLIMSLLLCRVALTVTLWLVSWGWPDYAPPEHDVIEGLRKPAGGPWVRALLVFGAVVVAPLAEEVYFRGILQTALRNLTGRPWLAICFASVVFGLAHAAQPHAVPALALLGGLLGYLYERSGSLVAPLTLHVLFNLNTVVRELSGVSGA